MTAPTTTPPVTDCTARVDPTRSHVQLCLACDDCLAIYAGKMDRLLPQMLADGLNAANEAEGSGERWTVTS